MKTQTEIKVGYKYRKQYWTERKFILVMLIGKEYFLGTSEEGGEIPFLIDANWEEYIEPEKPTVLSYKEIIDRLQDIIKNIEGTQPQ